MDVVATLLTGGSVLGLLAVGFIYLLSGNRADRVDYRKALAQERAERAEVEKELDVALTRARAAEDREATNAREAKRLGEKVDNLTAQVANLTAQVTQLRQQLGLP